MYPPHKYYYRKLLGAIKKIKTAEQIEIVANRIENTLKTYRITYEECEDLWSKPSERASKVGERKLLLKLGPWQIGGERKGTIF